MRNNEVDSSVIFHLAELLCSARDQVHYVSKKYLTVPLQINRNYGKMNSKRKPKIKLLPRQSNAVTEIDNAKIEKITYYVMAVLDFIDVVEKKLPISVLNNFYHNINGLRVVKLANSEKFKDATGLYDAFQNIIFLKKNCVDSIYHELFHMASSRIYRGVAYSGFSIYEKNKPVVGRGINEGYTELISYRYFGNFRTAYFLEKNYGPKNTRNPLGTAYPFQVLIAIKLEQIVGQRKMEELYLNANLYGLINELKQYASKDEINRFIKNLDFLDTIVDDVYKFSIKNKKIHQAYVEICSFLVNCYSKKMDNDHEKELTKNSKMESFTAELETEYDNFFSLDVDSSRRK